MKLGTLWYCIKQGFTNIKRNILFSIASIGTIAACIFLICLFYAVVVNVQYVVKRAEDSVDITVFFDSGISDDEIEAIGELITKNDQINSIEFTSAEEAWEIAKQTYFADSPELAEGFKDNPLANSASYSIKLKDITNQSEVVEFISGLTGVRRVNYSIQLAEGITSLDNMVSYISLAFILILFGVSVFLINNTITTAISLRKEEITIMRLIGSTKFMIRAPFIVEGLIIGLIGAAIPVVVMYFVYGRAIVFLGERLQVLSGIFDFLPNQQIFQFVIPVALILGVGIGLFGSTFSARKHLKA